MRRCACLIAACTVILLSHSGCSKEVVTAASRMAGYNVLLINIDTLRADHLGSYGYRRPTSPLLDSLAARAVQFDNAVSNSSFTRESVASLFTGRLPSCSGSVGWRAHPPADVPQLAELLSAAGYRTALFSLTTMLTDPSFGKGFEKVEHLTDRWGLSRAGRQLSERVLEFLREPDRRPFYLYVHYLDPHGPYDPPDELFARFHYTPIPNPLSLYSDVRRDYVRLRREGFGRDDPRFDDLVLRYDAEIADTDRAIEYLIKGIGDLGLLNQTLVVVTADHGEEFLEHEFIEHAWTLYEEMLRIPLVLFAPDVLPAQRIPDRVSAVDVLPTLLQLLGITRPDELDGTPLPLSTREAAASGGAQRETYAELLTAERNVLRSVTRGRWKYIAVYRWLEPDQRPAAAVQQDLPGQQRDFDPASTAPVLREELYDLQRDAAESRNVFGERPKVGRALRELLNEQVRECAGRRPTRARPSPDLSPQEHERLRALGYVE